MRNQKVAHPQVLDGNLAAPCQDTRPCEIASRVLMSVPVQFATRPVSGEFRWNTAFPLPLKLTVRSVVLALG